MKHYPTVVSNASITKCCSNNISSISYYLPSHALAKLSTDSICKKQISKPKKHCCVQIKSSDIIIRCNYKKWILFLRIRFRLRLIVF